MPDISVIVPVYNVEKYIHRCIDSILAQTFTDFELILVDDGSTDSSGKICDEYSAKDNRVFVIHKENGGVSSARNSGLSKAQGQYVAFVDSDDFVDKHYLEKLLSIKAELCICGARYLDEAEKFLGVALKTDNKIEKVTEKCILNWYEQGALYSVWGRIFMLSIIKEYDLLFDVNTTRGEDTIFMFNYVERCSEVGFISDELYNYVKYGLEGSSSGRLNKKNVMALDYIDCFIDNWLHEHGLFSKKFDSIEYWTKNEQLLYFWQIYKDNSIPFNERYHWYKLFFSLNSFSSHIPDFFSAENRKFLWVMERKSALLLTIFQILAGKNDT